MFKAPTVGVETIISSYGKPKDSATFFKSNEALSRYSGINLMLRGPMAVRAILSVTEIYLRLPEDFDNTEGKVYFLKWETEFKAISKNKLT